MISFYLSMLQTKEERDIFEDFYKKNYDRLVRIAFKNVHNKHDSEEAVSEAFKRIMDKPEKFFSLDEKKRVAFVDVVVRNVSVDMFKKSIRESFIDDVFPEEEPASNINVEREVVGKCSEADLKEFIKTLSDYQKEALMLKMTHGFSYSEIAESLNITEATARKRVSLAYAKIREFLEK